MMPKKFSGVRNVRSISQPWRPDINNPTKGTRIDIHSDPFRHTQDTRCRRRQHDDDNDDNNRQQQSHKNNLSWKQTYKQYNKTCNLNGCQYGYSS